MKPQSTLEIGRIYFGLAYEDDDLKYPIVHSYEYLGLSEKHPDTHKFRNLGSNDHDLVKDEELEFILDTEDVAKMLQEWARKNPKLSS